MLSKSFHGQLHILAKILLKSPSGKIVAYLNSLVIRTVSEHQSFFFPGVILHQEAQRVQSKKKTYFEFINITNGKGRGGSQNYY